MSETQSESELVLEAPPNAPCDGSHRYLKSELEHALRASAVLATALRDLATYAAALELTYGIEREHVTLTDARQVLRNAGEEM